MINKTVPLSEIRYEKRDPGNLTDSIRRRGMAIAVQVNACDGYYECVDGNRRLTAMSVLSEEDERFSCVPVMIMNDYSKAGSGFWGNTQNHH